MTLEEILKAIDSLPEEDKAKVKAKIQDLDKAEDEREIDKIEEEKSDVPEVEEDKAEDVKDESKEIGKDVDALKEEVSEEVPEEDLEEKEIPQEPTEEVEEVEEVEEQPEQAEFNEEAMTDENAEEVVEDEGEKTVTEEGAKENLSEMVHGLTDRLAQIEEQMNSMFEIKAKLEEMAQKKDKAFGYESKIPGAKKDYSSMTADELKKELAVSI